jgi:hypothetical protein
MDIAHWIFMLCPVLGALVGYLVDGMTGATSGFLIPVGPLMMAWIFESR